MQRWLGLFIVTGLVAGCGGGREERAVAACEQAVGARLEGRNLTLDREDMRNNAKATSDAVLEVSSSVVFDRGLANESTQRFMCRAQFDAANAAADPVVTFVQFW